MIRYLALYFYRHISLDVIFLRQRTLEINVLDSTYPSGIDGRVANNVFCPAVDV